MVTAQSLLHGAVYSLEQCGRLLRDARLLYENLSYATALVFASFAREELGRWTMLLALRKRVLAGASPTVEEIKDSLGDHGRKQERGMRGVVLRGNNRAGVGKLVQSYMKAPLGSKEGKEADQQIKKIGQQKSKRTPDERHRLRMNALYVDLLSEEQWNQPAREISRTTAYEFLNDAIGDYEVERQQGYTELPLVKSVDQELHDALVRWSDRPELPQVAAPSFLDTE
jgi:AbiV family abortive infection protein